MRITNRNLWSNSEVLTLLELGPTEACKRLGRSFSACKYKHALLKQSPTPKINPMKTLDDQVFILTKSVKDCVNRFGIKEMAVYYLRKRLLAKLQLLKMSNPEKYTRVMQLITKEGGFYKAVVGRPRKHVVEIYNAQEDLVSTVRKDKANLGFNSPVEEVNQDIEKVLEETELQTVAVEKENWLDKFIKFWN